MKTLCCARTAIIVIITWLCLTTCVSASGEIAAYIGDAIPLQGYSNGSPVVYLFLTGPNLPVNGVALNDITSRADEGHFTEVPVDNNNHWQYTWVTNAIGGRLDAGSYTLWVVNRPKDRSQLAKTDYSTLSIRLATPTVKVQYSEIPGALVVYSSPDGASVFIENIYRGSTPLIIEQIEPGTYRVTFSRPGYSILSTPVKVESAKTTEVSGKLIPLTGSLEITTIPAGAKILFDAENRGVTPLLLPNVTIGNHTLFAVKEGYFPSEHDVTVIENQTTKITISLIPASPPHEDTLQVSGSATVILLGFIAILLVIRYLGKYR